jgi:hypothetical protein
MRVVSGVKIEDTTGYQSYGACFADPTSCTRLYAARPPSGQRVFARDALSVSERLGGWGGGTQERARVGAHGHHPHAAWAVYEPWIHVRFLPPSTLYVALNDAGY